MSRSRANAAAPITITPVRVADLLAEVERMPVYVHGVVAMAKAGAEPAGTAGSQFFVVTAEDAGLPPDYAIVGKVTEGMDTVKRVEALGVGDGPPSQPVVVSSVTVGES